MKSSSMIAAQPVQEPGALITRRDFEILKEGAGGRELASRRNVCLGVFLTSMAGVVSCFLVAESVTEWGVGCVMVLGVVAGVTAVLALVFHVMSRGADSRQVYRETCNAIEAALPPPVRVAPVAAIRLVRVDVTPPPDTTPDAQYQMPQAEDADDERKLSVG